MNKFLFRLLCLVCLSTSFSVFAQETPDPQDPKKQPLEKPTEAQEAPKKQDPNEVKEPIPLSVAGGTPAGQTPTNTQDGTFVNRFQDIPVNLYTGTPMIGFPIYTLSESGGASVPLGLSYNASGMKGHDVSGWVGMNWTTSFQFQISRIVRGIPDEGRYTLESNFNRTARKGFYQYGLKANNDEENDSQPDLFFLSINGQSYKFSFDINKKAHFYPEADIDVQVTWQERYNVGDIVGVFRNWIITMPDGTKYNFSGNETESSFEMEANEATNGSARYGTSDFYKYVEAEEIISAWYCSKITTTFGHETNFEYYGTNYSFFRVADQSATTVNCTFNGIPKQLNKIFVSSSMLFKISNGTHVVEINKGGWTQGYNEDGSEYWYLNNTYPARQDIDVYGRFPVNFANTRALHKITVYAKDDPTKVFEWKFNYENNFGNDPTFLFTNFPGYNHSTIGYTHQRRFKLRSIEEPSGNKYTFKYYDDNFILPSRLTQGIDHWGYLNGVLGANTMIGEDAFRTCTSSQYANRNGSEGWSQYGTLTGISHSTGGNTLLEYENHTAHNYTRIIGGSRIKKIMFIDSISNLKTTKRYDYQQVNKNSSGFLCLKPVYHFDSKENIIGLRDEYWYSSLYQQLLSESGRPSVGYSRVKETILSGDETDSLGYTISEFLQPTKEIKIQETVYYNCRQEWDPILGDSITVCDSSKYIRPWKWNPYHENTVGVSSRVAVYGRSNQILSEKKSVFTEQQLQGTSVPYQQNYHSFRLVNKNYNFENTYFEFYNTFRQTSDTTKIYSQNGTNPVITYSTQEYPLQGKHNQVIKITTKDSYGSIITNTMKYPLDFQLGMASATNPEALGIQALQQKHILTAVIESITRVRQDINSNNVFITNAAYQTFYKADSTGVKAGMPKSSFGLENLPRTSMTEASNDPNTNIFTRSTDYDLKSTANSYTTIGLPVQHTTRFGATSKINYDATYPTLPISQVSNMGQPSEQTISTAYAKILYGVSKQVGANNLEVNSEYYADGKLKQQTDKDGNVLKHVQYVYRGQADNDPLLTTNTGYNRIITRVPRIATTTPLTLTHLDCGIFIVYMDGAGRVIQNVGYRVSPNEKDMISGVVEYDKFNRLFRAWLTVESSQNTGVLLDTALVKSSARTFYQDQKPYSEVLEYENSPLSRIFKSYGVGKVWQDSSKFVKMEYLTATGIRRLFVNNDDDFMANGTYPSYELSKSVSTDERGSQVIEYKDKAGNTVRRDVQVDATNFLTTLMCFDAAGRLRYIFPPKAVIALGNSSLNVESWADFNENVYAFHYDGRQRIFESHKPGIGWSRTVFSRLNQPVLSQDDDELAKNNTWTYAQTDGLGRGVRSGQMQLPATHTRAYLQSLFDNFVDNQQFEERDTIQTSSFRKYTNRSFPTALRTYVNDATWKNIHYFDDYKFRYTDVNSGTIAQYGFQINPYNSTAYSVTNAKGLMTGELHKIDNFGDFAFPSTVYYDDKNRALQSIVYQDLYARNQSDTKYNFVGESLMNRMIYRKRGDADRIITKETTLDHVGRTKDFYYTLREGTVDKIPKFKMSSLFYDNLGRLLTKVIEPKDNVVSSLNSGIWSVPTTWMNGIVPNLTTPAIINQGHTVTIQAGATVQAGSLFDAGTLKFLTNSRLILGSLAPVRGAGLQTISYSYNVLGKMRGINLDANGNPQVSQDKLFSYKIDYHEDGRYFNGLISKQTWKSLNSPENRSYLYSYDRSDRLINAQYSGVGTENYSVSNSYDANGNILTLQRYSKTGTNTFGLVDNLTYGYISNGNKLQKVDDVITGNTLANDFRDVSGNDYTFSVDGKLTKDNNKSIFNIKYNFLDLVSKITFNDSTKVEYFYTSTGERRQRKVTQNGVTSYTLYDGEVVYTFTGVNTSLNDFKVSEIQNGEGRYVNGKLEYAYTDHIGNLRLSYKDSSGVAFITQSQSYDPWSNVNAGSEYQLTGLEGDRYLVSGKENDNVTGNTLLDWRDYDSVTGRMNSFDPDDSEDGQISLSPFAYSWNNPVSLNDPNGRCPMCIGFMIGMFTSAIGNMASGKMPSNFGQFLLPGVTGAIGGGVGAGMAGIFGQAGTFGGAVIRGAVGGAISGGISGGVGSMLSGGNFGNGFLDGAISGGISGGIMGGIGHLRMQAKIAASVKMPAGYGKDDVLPFEDDFLNDFAETNFGEEFADKYGVSNLTTADNFRGQKGVQYDKSTGDLNDGRGYFDAITNYNEITTNRMSDIYVSKSAFMNSKRLFTVLGHEFVHSSHYKMGLYEVMLRMSNNDIKAANSLFHRFSEGSAYSYTLVTSKNLGDFKYSDFIRNTPSANGFLSPKTFGWRRLGIPTTLK